MDIQVKDLSVTIVDKNKQPRKLLEGISFRVEPNEVIALMGPSGAGKTTLLNRLVGRGFSGEVVGNISYSGVPCEKCRSHIGYVTQDDIMYETLTPRENMYFTARFLQGNASYKAREDSINETLRKLRLEKCADTVVGSPGLVKGISGGERKRTNVALSLLGNPSLLLLDEPTSGLDAKMADELMGDLQKVAASGCTVIATIHQPSEAVFDRFHKVLLLDAGRITYSGPVKGLRDLLLSLMFSIPDHMPLPEALLEILEVPKDDEAAVQKHYDRMTTLRDKIESKLIQAEDKQIVAAHLESKRVGICRQLLILTHRTALNVKRTKMLTVVRTVQTVMATLLMSWIFKQLTHDVGGVRDRMFVLFLVCFAQFLFSTLGVVNTFAPERAVFLREAQDRWYHPVAFYLSKVIVDFWMQCIFPVIAVLICYWFVGLNTESPARWFLFYTTTMLMSQSGASVGFAISSGVSSVSTALAIAPATILPQILLAGLFKPIYTLPQPFHALSHISAARYALQAVIANEFTCSIPATCTAAARMIHGDQCSQSSCPYCCSDVDVLSTKGICPVITCDDAIILLGQAPDKIWPSGSSNELTVGYNLICLIVLMVIFRLLGLISLLLAYRRASKSG